MKKTSSHISDVDLYLCFKYGLAESMEPREKTLTLAANAWMMSTINEAFLQDFVETLKHSLQNFYKILCLVTSYIVQFYATHQYLINIMPKTSRSNSDLNVIMNLIAFDISNSSTIARLCFGIAYRTGRTVKHPFQCTWKIH